MFFFNALYLYPFAVGSSDLSHSNPAESLENSDCVSLLLGKQTVKNPEDLVIAVFKKKLCYKIIANNYKLKAM
ncbi:MAG: hypothetical protein LBS83_01715 [Holosporales bacterium]|nr:hypothetical protein [Holosporales bacterium]